MNMRRFYNDEGDSIADDMMSWGDPSPEAEMQMGGMDFGFRHPMAVKEPIKVERCNICGDISMTSWCCAPVKRIQPI